MIAKDHDIESRQRHAPQVALPIYIANMLTSLKAKSMEDNTQVAIMGHSNAFPSVPKASASDWTIMQSLHILTLCQCASLRHTKAEDMFGKQQCVNSPTE